MMTCVKNEGRLIADHLVYHRYLGVSRAYVFLDGCTDDTLAVVRTIPWAVPIDCPRDPEVVHLTEYQNHCASIALELARQERFGWLLHMDVDEFVGIEVERERPGGWLNRLLKSVPREVELVRMRTKEAVPVLEEKPDKLWAQEYFQAEPNVLTRPVLDPTTGKLQNLGKWIGHNQGKSIVRVQADVLPVNAHTWMKVDPGQTIHEMNVGWHYHFVVGNAEHWREKYSKLSWEPETWENGNPVPFPKQAWKTASIRMTTSEAEQYYRNWVAIPEAAARRLTDRGLLSRERNVARVMKRAKRDPMAMLVRALAVSRLFALFPARPPVACEALTRSLATRSNSKMAAVSLFFH